MKIKIPVVVEKVFEAPDFLRDYITGGKDWFYMNKREVKEYEDWYDNLIENEGLLDFEGNGWVEQDKWKIVED